MPKKVDESTVIQFNLKWFITIIGSIIISFGSFYFGVQKPNNDSIKDYMKELMEGERKYQDLRFEKLDEMQITIDGLKKSIEDLSKRDDDLNRLKERSNTGGSLGN